MVAIVSGDSLGLSLSSLATLGQGGTSGTSGSGRNGEQAFVNAANGNLVLQIQDDYLASIGADVSSLRTYNSQGQLAGQDSWAVGAERQRIAPVADSTSKLIRTERDGATAVYEWSGSASAFLSTAGDGAYDSIVAENGGYIWTDGATGLKEHFGTTGRLIRSEDADGQIITYGYTDGRLTTVTDASGEKVDYRYDNGLLTSIKTTLADGTSASRVSYTYDAGRLQTATVDLSTQDGGVPVGRVYETRYTYEGSSQRVASITQSDGTSLAFTYTLVDGQYRVASVKDGLHHITSYAYDLAARQTTVIDPVGLVTVYTYDDKAQLKRVETGDVSASPSSLATTTIELAVDPVQVTSSTDAQGVTTLSWQQPATATHTLWRYRAQGSGDQGWSTLNPASSNGMQTVVLPSPALGPFEYELLLTPEGSSVPTGRAIGTYEVVSVTQGRYETIHHEVPKVEVQILAGTGFGQSRMEWSAPANATTTWRYRPAGNATAAWSSLNVETANGKQWVDLSGLAAGSHDFELVETANGVPVGHAVGTLAITTQQAVYLTMAPAQHPVTAGQGSNGQPQLSWTLPPQGTTTTFRPACQHL